MTTIENNRCYACAKLFCCLDCCTEHIKKKHPSRESECPLCRSERLIVKNFENQEFLCHVVFHHLPLYCRICGLEFKNCKDLQTLGNCNIFAFNCHVDTRKKIKLPPETPSPVNKITPCGTISSSLTKIFTNGSISDYNDNFGNLISPPELTRNTSTPMHDNLLGLKTNFAFKTPKSPNFSFKTPKTPSLSTSNIRKNDKINEKENNSSNTTNYKDLTENFSINETNYQSFTNSTKSTSISDRTPLRSILSNRSSIMSENSSYFTRINKAGKKMLDAMQEIDENVRNVDEQRETGDLMENLEFSQASIDNTDNNHNKDCAKRVRFSDQFEIDDTTNVSTSEIDAEANEEFHDARQGISDASTAVMEKLSASEALINRENETNFEREKKQEDEENDQKEEKEKEENDVVKSSRSEFVDNNLPIESSSSSRVIMMVVVEKNGTSGTKDLAPLIDSSLKKLIETTENLQSNEILINSNDSSQRENIETIPGTSILSVDSCVTVSTVECYKTTDSTNNRRIVSREITEDPRNSSGTTGGIFSSMAHAMRMAFRNLSGVNSPRNLSREPLGQSQNLSLLSSIPEASATTSKVLTSLASALVPRTAKRSRDTDDVSTVRSMDIGDPLGDVRSPVPKRPRGWYKIRGREPIARMRNNSVNSTTEFSLETQYFPQRSLSLGDVKLPSLVDQSTQTD